MDPNTDPDAVRTARPDELALLPPLEAAADTMFDHLGIGPLPAPGTPDVLAAALVVLVVGDPPQGFARIDELHRPDDRPAAPRSAHLEQLAVHPDHARRGLGRALLEAALAWAASRGYEELTLATYRDVPWNGPFYASAGFEEAGLVDDWYAERSLPPEEPVMRRGGVRVLMRRAVRPPGP